MTRVTLVECPRDAWQGLAVPLPTEMKAAHVRSLLAAGFRHIDAVSFVSPKYVPQMADSESLLRQLAPFPPGVEIIGIVVDRRGLHRAVLMPGVTTIGYPHSLSERFLRQNANLSVKATRTLTERLAGWVREAERSFVVYISMAFGNPYGEAWSPDDVVETVEWLGAHAVRTVSLADTAGTATAERIAALCRDVCRAAPGVEIGVHLHSRRESAAEKVLAAFEAGIRRFDGALAGLGGCPFAHDELVGNIPTEIVAETLGARGVDTEIDPARLDAALAMAQDIKSRYSGAA